MYELNLPRKKSQRFFIMCVEDFHSYRTELVKKCENQVSFNDCRQGNVEGVILEQYTYKLHHRDCRLNGNLTFHFNCLSGEYSGSIHYLKRGLV